MSLRIVLLLLCCANVQSWAATADEPRTVTVAVSRSAVLVPDQAVFTVSVAVPSNTTLDQAVSSLQSFGVTSQSLTSVQSLRLGEFASILSNRLQYTFGLVVPVTQVAATISSLQTASAASQSGDGTGPQISFQLQSLQISDARIAQARLPALADLLAEAKQRALLVSQASGWALGPLRSVRSISYGGLSSSFSRVVSIYDPFPFSSPTPAQQIQFGLLVTYDLAQ